MNRKLARGPTCGVDNCRSRRYEEGEDGFLYCQKGHRQQGLIRGEDDEDNFTTASRVVTRKKRDTENEKTVKHFSGQKAFDLYLKSLQIILRHQIWFLVQERGLPAELETVVFDFWALRIAQLGDRIGSYDLGSDLQPQSTEFSSLDTYEVTSSDKSTLEPHKRGDKDLAAAPNLKDCLALCYLGTLTLRLSISPGDIFALVTDGKLIYRRSIMHVPLEMRDRLQSTYHDVLDPNSLPKYEDFYRTVRSIQCNFGKNYGILWPALNAPLLLFRYLRELALPLELYEATLRLAEYLECDHKPLDKNSMGLKIRHLPEAQLIGCLIVCIKLLYPFDNQKRYPRSSSEPSAVLMDWSAWCKKFDIAKSRQDEQGQCLDTEELTMLEEKDVFSLTSDQLDQYLDFYMHAFLDKVEMQRVEATNNFRKALHEMFPIEGGGKHSANQLSDRPSHQKRLKLVEAVHSHMEPVGSFDDESASHIVRPGQKYQMWKREELLPDDARALYDGAARIAGLSKDMVVLVVYSVEVRLERYMEKRKSSVEKCKGG